jgi:hypothetical protein
LEPTDILLAAKTLLLQGSTITIQINCGSIYDQIDVPDKPRNSITDVNTNKAWNEGLKNNIY